VVYASDCFPNENTDDDFGTCPCGLDYAEECVCPGPTEDGVQYKEVDGVLYGKKHKTDA